jgi:hypothetical protein
MSTNITINTSDPDMPIHRIVLAESDPLEIARIQLNIDQDFQSCIKIVKNYDELLATVAKNPPQLVILGRIDKLNYFDICQNCLKLRKELLIVLISRQEVVNYSFHQVIKSYGVSEIISSDFTKLNQLLQTLDVLKETDNALPSAPIITSKMLLSGLEEIASISGNYFGTLAQGNYWRKAHARSIDEFSFLLNWSADHFGKLTCEAKILEQPLTDANIQALQTWVQLFLGECERVIVDYGEILGKADLSPAAKSLLTKP